MKIEPQNIDRSILERISEAEVREWMAARLTQAREASGLQLEVFSASVFQWRHLEEQDFEFRFTLRVGGASFGCDSPEESFDRILTEADPKTQVARLKEQASKLLADAAKLETAALEGGAK